MKKTKSEGRSSISRLSITSRMMLYLMTFVAVVLALLWLFQIAWLDSFYQYYKTRQLENATQTLTQAAAGDGFTSAAEEVAQRSDICVLLLNSELSTAASAEGMRTCIIHHMSPAQAAWLCARADAGGGSYTGFVRNSRKFWFQFTEPEPPMDEALPVLTPAAEAEGQQAAMPSGASPEFNSRFGMPEAGPENEEQYQSLVRVKKVALSDGTEGYLLLNTVISPVTATVSTLRSQLSIITIVVLLMALLLGFWVSRQLSRPIIETNEAAHGLSRARYERPRHSGSYREIAELNDTLEKAAEELGQVENLQHELIANISHDLRTPLTMIGGYAEVMRDIPGESTPENMQIIIDETAHLSTLVNELLDFSRMQTGSAPMNIAPFCLTDTVSAIVTRVGQMVAGDGYTVVFSPSFTCEVAADESRISQVVYNLIGNALTYTGADKTVRVTQTRIENRVRVSITDTGKGIAPDELPLIWNRYYRTKETHKRAIIGSGLGLNIVQTILEQHHAPYGVSSELNQGTTFWFELPLCES